MINELYMRSFEEDSNQIINRFAEAKVTREPKHHTDIANLPFNKRAYDDIR